MNQIDSRLVDLDGRLVAAARSIKILSRLTPPASARSEFLARHRAGRAQLPDLSLPSVEHADAKEELGRILSAASGDHPVEVYVAATAQSYLTAAEMLENTGSARFTELSGHLYGRPMDSLRIGGRTYLDAAREIVRGTDAYDAAVRLDEADFCVTPAAVADRIRAAADAAFGPGQVLVEIDPALSSKAAAGALRIRVRGSTCFSELDIPQLIEHELFVHTLTARNGRRQPSLRSAGLGAPRTTRAQEGLATFAELITTSMDLSRLRRLALRVTATQRALEGADFLDIFRYFQAAGQTEAESYQSAARIFRGGDPRGRIVFLKDSTYLLGLMEVHDFLEQAIRDGKIGWTHALFTGRWSLEDIARLEPWFESGFIAPASDLPSWIESSPCLAAFLLYSSVSRLMDHTLEIQPVARQEETGR